MTTKELIARWQSWGGKYWAELYRDADGTFSYRGDNSGGYNLWAGATVTDALDAMRREKLPAMFPGNYERVR